MNECLQKFPTKDMIRNLPCYKGLPSSFRYHRKKKEQLSRRELCEALAPLKGCPWKLLPPSLEQHVPRGFLLRRFARADGKVPQRFAVNSLSLAREFDQKLNVPPGNGVVRMDVETLGSPRPRGFNQNRSRAPGDEAVPIEIEPLGSPKPLLLRSKPLRNRELQSPIYAAIIDKINDAGYTFLTQFLDSPEKYAAHITGPKGPPLAKAFLGLPYLTVKLFGKPGIAQEETGYGASTCFGYRYLFEHKFPKKVCLAATEKKLPWAIPIEIMITGPVGIRRKVYLKTRKQAFDRLLKCLKNEANGKLIIVPLTLSYLNFTHAQVLLIDTVNNVMDYFDSQGSLFGFYNAQKAGELLRTLLITSVPTLADYQFNNIRETVGSYGPALTDGVFGFPLFKIRPEDRTGYSDIWCLIFAALRTEYRDTKGRTIVKFLESFSGPEKREILYRFAGYLARAQLRIKTGNRKYNTDLLC